MNGVNNHVCGLICGKDTVTYTKLLPQKNGKCVEKIYTQEDFCNALFPFNAASKLHIFCICIDGIDIIPQNISDEVLSIWRQAINQRRIDDCAYLDKPFACGDYAAFVDALASDMYKFGYIEPTERENFKKSFDRPYDENEIELYYGSDEKGHVALVYLISTEVYEALMQCYKLPRKGTSVIKMVLNVIVPYDEYMKYKEDKERNVSLNKTIDQIKELTNYSLEKFLEGLLDGLLKNIRLKQIESLKDDSMKYGRHIDSKDDREEDN